MVMYYTVNPTLSVYHIKLDYISDYGKPQLWLVLLVYGADVIIAFLNHYRNNDDRVKTLQVLQLP